LASRRSSSKSVHCLMISSGGDPPQFLTCPWRQVLDGGWKQWVADSSPVETALPTAFPTATTPWRYSCHH